MNDVVNLRHIKLFHHFQTETRNTLLYTPEVWDHALQLSFNFECLMHAVLCISARHLAYLHPDNTTYPATAANHLDRALSKFRLELSNDLTSVHLDVFVTTSILIQFELWINVDFLSTLNKGEASFDPTQDPMFTFSSTLKQVFLRSFPFDAIQASKFMPYIRDNPIEKLSRAVKISDDTVAEYQDFFAYSRPISSKMLNPLPSYTRATVDMDSHASEQDASKTSSALLSREDGYRLVVSRLCLILSFLPESDPPEPIDADSPLLPLLARCILFFPVMCHGPFTTMVHQGDPHALLLVYHFYRVIRELLYPAKYWWVHNRAHALGAVFGGWLNARYRRK